MTQRIVPICPTRTRPLPSKRHRETCDAARRWLDNPWVVDGRFVQVDDIEGHHARAVAAGATVIRRSRDFTGLRRYTAEDLEGHGLMFGQPVPARDG